MAIARYLARKFGLSGANEIESAQADMYIDSISDLFNASVPILLERDETKQIQMNAAFLAEKIVPYVDRIEKHLAKNRGQYLVGKSVRQSRSPHENRISSMIGKPWSSNTIDSVLWLCWYVIQRWIFVPTVDMGGSGAHELFQLLRPASARSFESSTAYEAADRTRGCRSQDKKVDRNSPQDPLLDSSSLPTPIWRNVSWSFQYEHPLQYNFQLPWRYCLYLQFDESSQNICRRSIHCFPDGFLFVFHRWILGIMRISPLPVPLRWNLTFSTSFEIVQQRDVRKI